MYRHDLPVVDGPPLAERGGVIQLEHLIEIQVVAEAVLY
jgi:hypothetical protein